VNYLFRRLLLFLPTLLVLSLLVFVMLEVTPGSAASAVLDDASSDSAAVALCAQLRCNQPLLARYVGYLGDVLRGDFGVSVRSGRDVGAELLLRVPHTLIVSALAIAAALVIGGLLGILAAVRRGTIVDVLITFVTSIGASMPTFWVALLLVSLFAVRLRWLPVFGMGEGISPYVLPVAAVALALIPGLTMLVRSTVIEARQQLFINTAYGKGLAAWHVYGRHILPVAAIPIITYLGMQAVHLIGALVTIEVLFSLPGLGGLAVQAALDRDPMLLQGAVLMIATITLILLLLVDLAVMLLDPRIIRKPEQVE
jgi:peptide/nickel transport system permease protein